MNNAPNSGFDSTLASLFRPLAVVFGLASAIVVIVFDIIIKQYITIILLNARGPIEVTQFFNLVLGFNRGVSFGLLSSESAWVPWALSAAAVLIAAWLAFRLLKTVRIVEATGLGLIIGGAIANAVDRLADGAVTDYLDFHVGDLHWPAFNLADAAIVCGVAIFAFFMTLANKPSLP